MANDATAAAAAVRGTGSLMGLVVAQRLVSFALNQVLLRFTRPEVFGVVVVGLELLKDTSLFFGREGLRLALLRQPSVSTREPTRIAQIVNAAWLAMPLSALAMLVLAAMALLWPSTDASVHQTTSSVNGYPAALALYGLAIVLEAACEPAYVIAQNQMNFTVRVAAEACALVVRSVVAVASVVVAGQELLGFAYAQVAYAATCVIVYYASLAYLRRTGTAPLSSVSQLMPRLLSPSASTYDHATLSLAFTFTKQSLLKHLLTEGDRLVLSVQSSRVDQGVFGAVSNLGSLAVRVLFQPIEETTRALFAKLTTQSGESQLMARTLLVTVCKFVTLIGLLFACFGSNYTHLLLYTLLGSHWASTDAPRVLAWYCLYVLVLAANGVTEAFVYAVATDQQVKRINYILVLFSALYAATGLVGIQYFGTTGLVLANCLSMICRIMYSFSFIRMYFEQKFSVVDLLPRWPVLTAFVCSFLVLKIVAALVHPVTFEHPYSAIARVSTALYVGTGGVLAGLVLFVVFLAERSTIEAMRQLVRGQTPDQGKKRS